MNFNFLICGGLAYSILVEPRATLDIDIIIKLKKKDFKLIEKGLREVYDDVLPHKNLMHFKKVAIWRIILFDKGEELIFDLIFVDDNYFSEMLKRKINLEIEKNILPFVSPEDLYILKILSGREIDKWDIKKIKEKYKKSFDFDYVNKWIKKLKG